MTPPPLHFFSENDHLEAGGYILVLKAVNVTNYFSTLLKVDIILGQVNIISWHGVRLCQIVSCHFDLSNIWRSLDEKHGQP